MEALIAWLIGWKPGKFLVAAAAVAFVAGAFYWFAYSNGADGVKAEQTKQSLKNTRDREKNDQKIDSLPDAELDARFNRWVH